MITVREVSSHERARFGPEIRRMEAGISYPLGDDFFEIDHGADYFAFFDRMGEAATFVALEDERVLASATGVLRHVPGGSAGSPAWYGCDLKVDPAARGRRIPLRLLLAALRTKYRMCGRGYGVAMHPADGRQAAMVRLASHVRVIGSEVGASLNIYRLDTDTMARCAPILEAHRGPLSYLSLAGKKDIVLRSSLTPLPLMHVQFGPSASPGRPTPLAGYEHMFCAPTQDHLCADLSKAGVAPAAGASVVHHRMRGWDWRFVLTSDL